MSSDKDLQFMIGRGFNGREKQRLKWDSDVKLVCRYVNVGLLCFAYVHTRIFFERESISSKNPPIPLSPLPWMRVVFSSCARFFLRFARIITLSYIINKSLVRVRDKSRPGLSARERKDYITSNYITKRMFVRLSLSLFLPSSLALSPRVLYNIKKRIINDSRDVEESHKSGHGVARVVEYLYRIIFFFLLFCRGWMAGVPRCLVGPPAKRAWSSN